MWIRIRPDPDSFGSVDPDPDPEVKITDKIKGKAEFTNKNLFFSLQEIIFFKFEPKKEYVQSDLKIKRCFENVILLTWIRPGSWIRIRIYQILWIRIRIQSIWIHITRKKIVGIVYLHST